MKSRIFSVASKAAPTVRAGLKPSVSVGAPSRLVQQFPRFQATLRQQNDRGRIASQLPNKPFQSISAGRNNTTIVYSIYAQAPEGKIIASALKKLSPRPTFVGLGATGLGLRLAVTGVALKQPKKEEVATTNSMESNPGVHTPTPSPFRNDPLLPNSNSLGALLKICIDLCATIYQSVRNGCNLLLTTASQRIGNLPVFNKIKDLGNLLINIATQWGTTLSITATMFIVYVCLFVQAMVSVLGILPTLLVLTLAAVFKLNDGLRLQLLSYLNQNILLLKQTLDTHGVTDAAHRLWLKINTQISKFSNNHLPEAPTDKYETFHPRPPIN
jgi:hypothetical protein